LDRFSYGGRTVDLSLDDPIQVVFGAAGIVILVLGVVMTWPLRRPAGRRLILMGVAFLVAGVAYTLVQGWMAPTS
jgi:hypothetical protein